MAKLTPEEAKWAELSVKLRFLTQTEGWDAYLERLDAAEDDAFEDLLNADANSHDYWRGIILGLRQARNLPQDIAARLPR